MATGILALLTMLLAALPQILDLIKARQEKRNVETTALVDRDIAELERGLSGNESVPSGHQTGVRL